jgi:hypothetical protein
MEPSLLTRWRVSPDHSSYWLDALLPKGMYYCIPGPLHIQVSVLTMDLVPDRFWTMHWLCKLRDALL